MNDNATARIERCKDCEHARNECCTHKDAIQWQMVDWEASEGRCPWVWDVEFCPKEGSEEYSA